MALKQVSEQVGVLLNKDMISAEEQSTSEKKRTRLKNVLLDVLDKPTRNKTYYTAAMLPLEQLREKAPKGEVLMYLDHTNVDQAPIDGNKFAKLAAVINDIRWSTVDNATEVRADITIFNTPGGDIINETLDGGGVVGFSKRGGTKKFVPRTIQPHGEVLVPEPYQFMAWDMVPGQSVVGAQASQEQAVIEQLTIHEEKHKMNLDDLKKDQELWKQAQESISAELNTDLEKKINTATEALKKEFEAKAAPALEENKRMNTALTAIVESLVASGLVDNREPAAIEKTLNEKITTLETEKKALTEKIAAMEAEKLAAAPKPLDKPTVEQFFMSKTGGKAVLENMGERQFMTAEEMQAHYDSIAALAKSVLEVTQPPPGRGVTENQQPEEKNDQEKAKENLKRRAQG